MNLLIHLYLSEEKRTDLLTDDYTKKKKKREQLFRIFTKLKLKKIPQDEHQP